MGAVHIVENEDGSTNQIYRISVLIAGEENLHMRHVQEQIMGLVWSLQDEHLRIEDGDMLQIATPNIDILYDFDKNVEGVELVVPQSFAELTEHSASMHIWFDESNADYISRVCMLTRDMGLFTVVENPEKGTKLKPN